MAKKGKKRESSFIRQCKVAMDRQTAADCPSIDSAAEAEASAAKQ